MGKAFIRSVLAQDETVTVSTVVTYDLPVNPLSHILFTLKCLNDTGTITNYSVLKALLAQVSQIEVLFKGSAIVSTSMTDLAVLMATMGMWQPSQLNLVKTNNDVRAVTVPILFGRKPFFEAECFPAVRRGELQLRVTYAAAQTGIDTPIVQIETVELPEAAPTQFLKYTASSKTPTATGEHDVDLPIGNDILGVLLFGTTVPTGSSYNATIGKIKLLIDNVEAYYAKANWETLHNELARRADWKYYHHFHQFSGISGGVDSDTGLQQEDDSLIDNYAYLDFDPLGDDNYLLSTEGRSRVHLRIDQEPTADALRIIPVEIIKLSAA